jgi:hypothetical protein
MEEKSKDHNRMQGNEWNCHWQLDNHPCLMTRVASEICTRMNGGKKGVIGSADIDAA